MKPTYYHFYRNAYKSRKKIRCFLFCALPYWAIQTTLLHPNASIQKCAFVAFINSWLQFVFVQVCWHLEMLEWLGKFSSRGLVGKFVCVSLRALGGLGAEGYRNPVPMVHTAPGTKHWTNQHIFVKHVKAISDMNLSFRYTVNGQCQRSTCINSSLKPVKSIQSLPMCIVVDILWLNVPSWVECLWSESKLHSFSSF